MEKCCQRLDRSNLESFSKEKILGDFKGVKIHFLHLPVRKTAVSTQPSPRIYKEKDAKAKRTSRLESSPPVLLGAHSLISHYDRLAANCVAKHCVNCITHSISFNPPNSLKWPLLSC